MAELNLISWDVKMFQAYFISEKNEWKITEEKHLRIVL